MSSILKTQGIITTVQAYLNDLIVNVATNNIGNISVVAKNANSPNSKRGNLLKAGVELVAVLYYRNHYYLSSIEKISSLYVGINNWYGVKLFRLVLKALEEHWDVYSSNKYLEIKKMLERFSEEMSNARLFAITFNIFNELFLIDSNNLHCSRCNVLLDEGYFLDGKLLCNACAKNKEDKKGFKINLKTQDGQVKFFSQILEYWSF